MVVTNDELLPPTLLTRVSINHVTVLAENETFIRQHVMRNFIWVLTVRWE
jgi:hypothetical protein